MKDETKLLIWFRVLSPYSRTVRKFYLYSFQTSPFLGINNITVPVKKGSIWYVWLPAEETRCNNNSTTYFNDSSDNSNLEAERNACGIIAIPIIESNFYNDHIHVLHDLTKRYRYRYLISRSISSESTIQNMILQNIRLLLIWCDVK